MAENQPRLTVGQSPGVEGQGSAALQRSAVIVKQAGRACVDNEGLLRGQFALAVKDISCTVIGQVAAGLQLAAGIIEGACGGGHLLATLCGTATVIPVASGV